MGNQAQRHVKKLHLFAFDCLVTARSEGEGEGYTGVTAPAKAPAANQTEV